MFVLGVAWMHHWASLVDTVPDGKRLNLAHMVYSMQCTKISRQLSGKHCHCTCSVFSLAISCHLLLFCGSKSARQTIALLKSQKRQEFCLVEMESIFLFCCSAKSSEWNTQKVSQQSVFFSQLSAALYNVACACTPALASSNSQRGSFSCYSTCSHLWMSLEIHINTIITTSFKTLWNPDIARILNRWWVILIRLCIVFILKICIKICKQNPTYEKTNKRFSESSSWRKAIE